MGGSLNFIEEHTSRYTSIGSYPLHFVTDRGGIVCPTCAADQQDIRQDGSRVIRQEPFFEGEHACSECGELVEVAYGG